MQTETNSIKRIIYFKNNLVCVFYDQLLSKFFDTIIIYYYIYLKLQVNNLSFQQLKSLMLINKGAFFLSLT